MNNKNNEPKKKSLVKSGAILSLMTFASRIMGLIREMTKASFLGTNMFADAFTTAFMLPNLFRRLFAENAVSAAFIPTFKSYLSKGDDEENHKATQEFINATFTLVTFLTTCVVIIGIAASPLISLIFCHKPVDTQSTDYAMQLQAWLLKKDEVTVLSRIMFPYLTLISIAALFQGILNGHKIFAPSGITPVFFNGIVILATYILSPFTTNPARAMSIGTLLGGSVQALFQWPYVRKTGWKICFTSLKKTFSNPGTKKVIALVGPTIIGIAAYQLNDVFSTSFANRIGEGVTSSLQYSLRLQELILGIFAVSIGTVILPDLTGYANKNQWDDYNTTLSQAIKIMILISIPVTVYSLLTGKELISLLYKKNQFGDESVMLTLGVFRYHIAGLLFIALNRIIAPAFYAQGNSKLPAAAGVVSFAVNILLVFILSKAMKGNGIALALSLASLANTIVLFCFMKKLGTFKIGFILKKSIIYIVKITIYSIIAIIPTYFVHNFFVNAMAGKGRLIAYGVPVLISAIVFGAIGVLLLIITKDDITKVLLKKVKK